MKKNGFTIIEIAVVFVIISVVISFIVLSTNLQNQSICIRLLKDIEYFEQAVVSFKAQYKYLPGAYPYASTSFECTDASGTCASASSTTCNGNNTSGGGIIKYDTLDNTTCNRLRTAAHLSYAGFYSGTYKYVYTTPSSCGSKFKSCFVNSSYNSGLFTLFAPDSKTTFLRVSKITTVNNVASTIGAHFITPELMYMMDKKVDDGLPQSGKIALHSSACSVSSCCYDGLYNTSKAYKSQYLCMIDVYFD